MDNSMGHHTNITPKGGFNWKWLFIRFSRWNMHPIIFTHSNWTPHVLPSSRDCYNHNALYFYKHLVTLTKPFFCSHSCPISTCPLHAYVSYLSFLHWFKVRIFQVPTEMSSIGSLMYVTFHLFLRTVASGDVVGSPEKGRFFRVYLTYFGRRSPGMKDDGADLLSIRINNF